jgi:hypothetical protein
MNRLPALIVALAVSPTLFAQPAAPASDAKPDAKPPAVAPAGGEPAKPAAGATAYEIKVDTSDAPELKAYGEKIQKLSEEWYPKLIAMLPSENYAAPQRVVITFRNDYKGVAMAQGNRITCAVKWFKERPEDLGAVVHELAHVVQGYRRGKRPGWLVEGIADYLRFFHYEPANARPRPNPERAKHTDSYRTTGHFLNWVQETYDKQFVVKMNAACREARYSDDLWKEYTGKTLDELGAEWKASLAKK